MQLPDTNSTARNAELPKVEGGHASFKKHPIVIIIIGLQTTKQRASGLVVTKCLLNFDVICKNKRQVLHKTKLRKPVCVNRNMKIHSREAISEP